MVLIADDDSDIRESLADVLHRMGYEVATVSDGKEALEFLADTTPCLLLLDLMMPRVDGWQVTAKMHADPALADIPICVITAGTDRPPPELADVLRKPIELRELLDVVRAHC